jgi:hypothetical protein
MTTTSGNRLLTVATIVIALILTAHAPAARADIIYTPRDSYGQTIANGVKVYLSRACHNGSSSSNPCVSNFGCSGHVGENTWSAELSSHTLYEPDGQWGLVNRQYTVRIGTGKTQNNIASSNSWNSDVHLPLHSNASGSTSCGTPNSSDGTWGLYVSSSGRQMAEAWRDYFGSGSPGPNDKIVYRSNLGELNQTSMPAGYLEASFHTNRRGMEWMMDWEYYDWRVGYAVDKCAGYPRHAQGDTSSARCPWL